jgi:heme oxygenase
MLKASSTVDRYYLEMRGKCLALAADLDRIVRAEGGAEVLANDARLVKLHAALAVLSDAGPDKAERVQLVFSDRTVGLNS